MIDIRITMGVGDSLVERERLALIAFLAAMEPSRGTAVPVTQEVANRPTETANAPPAPPPPVSSASVIPAPPVTPAPTVSIQPTFSTPSPLGERDVKGTPWDARIHSAKRTRNENGEWRMRRGVDEITIARVLIEINGEAPGQPPVTLSPHATPMIVPPPPVSVSDGLASAATPAADPAALAMEFAGFMRDTINPAMAAGVLTQEQVESAVAVAGCSKVAELLSTNGALAKFEDFIRDIVE